jgi:protein-S-isoprenylcysteine O-methyltransferase Ste14
MFLVYAGIPLANESARLLGLLVVFTFVIRYGVVARERRYLERKFGSERTTSAIRPVPHLI